MIKVGVLRGGISNESGISLKTGESVLKCLPKQYSGQDIFLSSSGEWYLNGISSYPEKIFRSVDVIFNALHGEFGEDGKVQQIFETFSVPYTGSGALASAMGMNKILARDSFVNAGLLVPRGVAVSESEDIEKAAREIFRKMGPSLVVKPSSSGSSLGVSIVHGFHHLVEEIKKAFKHNIPNSKTDAPVAGSGPRVLVEEYIKGVEVSCGVIDNFRERKHYALPAIEISTPDGAELFDFKAKYDESTRKECPSNFNQATKEAIETVAQDAHRALGCRHYSCSDFIVSGKENKQIYLLELNTLPGLTDESLLSKSLDAVGSSHAEFLDHIIQEAMKR